MRAVRWVLAAVTVASSGAVCAAGPAKAPAAPGTAAQSAAARVHAQDIADLFRDACLGTKADPEAVADWALVNGFVTDSPASREVAAAIRQRGEAGNVFARPGGRDTLLLISTTAPSNCIVMGLGAVDGPRLRGRMEAQSADWPGVKVQPEPSRGMDYDQDGPHRSVSYLGVSGTDRYRLTVVSPLGTARGTAIMGVSVEPR
ncbi:hypothetical protein [Piscinibacter gummiphilus]|uniref:Uncharacterized protein n=1 Tax=Piscinibacter gummiphilus TaxID=946333 RepID=A0A1W6L8T6_9BURK|nr:hypothetical protein [Piscinibacter gummiphilus]ARN20578.1 hypothetical protein A4W93_12110 [Piscinibacter gummiphilus]ATU65254.1 hypothetical protein CPZ87_12185 [Piscinibacter gummiphilus]GLS98340.1 hypothetical protein GCM10007918_56320 [Piscinibacter gummiphilus]